MVALVTLRDVVDGAASNLPLLLGTVARASVVLACAAIVTALMRRSSAAARHLVWMSAILVALTLPLIARFAPVWNARVLPRVTVVSTDDRKPVQFDLAATPAPTQSTAQPLRLPVAEPPAATATSDAKTTVPELQTPAPSISPAQWVAIVWIVGALAVMLRLAIGTVVVWRIARAAKHVDDAEWVMLAQRTARELGIARPVTLLASEQQSVPVTWGVIYPVVLLPITALGWEHDRREAVLVHELAHVSRLDALTQTIVQLALAAFWFNPLVWIAAKRVRTERERACDDLVLSHGTRASFYADDLLSMVRTLTRNTEPAFAALAMARRTEFEGRMLAILDPAIDRRRLGRRGAIAAAAASLAVALPLAALRPLPRDAAGDGAGNVSGNAARPVSPGVLGTISAATSHEDSLNLLKPLAAAGASLDSTLDKLKAIAAKTGSIGVASCNTGGGQHTSIHSDDSQSSFVYSDDTTCLVVFSNGKITFADDDTQIQSISNGGHITITETSGGVRRRYEGSGENGRVVSTYYLNDRPADPASSEGWLRTAILRLVRQDASRAPPRVARIRRLSGIPGVLREIDQVSGDYAKRAYFDALLESGNISADTLRLITSVGARTLTSDYDKAEFLKRAAVLGSGSNADVFAKAAQSMSSDYYKHQMLTAALGGGGDKNEIARMVVANASDMSSEYDREALLLDVLARAKLSDASLLTLLASTEKMPSDYYRAAVLDSVVSSQNIGSKAVYTALLHSASGISGSYYRAHVLQHIAARHDLTPELATATLEAARSMDSDNEKANVLVAVAGSPSIKNTAVRDAFFSAAKTIESGTDYRRAMSAILP